MAVSIVDSIVTSFATSGSSAALSGSTVAVAGDVDIIIVGSDTTVSTPAGFAIPTNGTFVSNQGGYVFQRTCTGGESASQAFTTSGNFSTEVHWVRVRGLGTFDKCTNAHADSSGAAASPALNTGTLAATGEFVFVACVCTDAQVGAPTGPSWSSGYTPLGATNIGTGTAMAAGFSAYKMNAGTAAETPSVSWTNGFRNRYIFATAWRAASTQPDGARWGVNAGIGT